MPQGRTPLRDQRFRLISLAAGPIVGLIIVTVMFASGVFPPIPLGWFVAIIAVVLLLAVGGISAGLLLGKKLVGDRIELAYRAPGEKWRHGRADLSPGVMRLQKYWWQLRIPTGDPLTLEVESVAREERKPSPRQWWTMNPQLRITDMHTDRGTYEIGALPRHLAEVRDRLTRSSASPSR